MNTSSPCFITPSLCPPLICHIRFCVCVCTHAAFLPSDTSTQQQAVHILLNKKGSPQLVRNTPEHLTWRRNAQQDQACCVCGQDKHSLLLHRDTVSETRKCRISLLLHSAAQKGSISLRLSDLPSHKTPAACLQTSTEEEEEEVGGMMVAEWGDTVVKQPRGWV